MCFVAHSVWLLLWEKQVKMIWAPVGKILNSIVLFNHQATYIFVECLFLSDYLALGLLSSVERIIVVVLKSTRNKSTIQPPHPFPLTFPPARTEVKHVHIYKVKSSSLAEGLTKNPCHNWCPHQGLVTTNALTL